jgi:DNA processing protein
MGPARLVELLDRRSPSEVWAGVRAARVRRTPGEGAPRLAVGGDPGGEWAPVASPETVAAMADRLQRGRINVTWRGRDDYPARLVRDLQPPGVLFWRGELAWLACPCVAIVGTRSCTPEGARIAFEMGRDLSAAGVVVLSGLAIGIDGSAHAGVLDALERAPARYQAVAGPVASPVGVAASGPDVVYPRRHARLWERVARAGALLSEAPPGCPPAAWRFPARNRIIAALADLVVVVESHGRGGSLITAEAAIARGVEVRVVPGSVRSAASAGTNQLLSDGPGPVRDARDVLDALGFVLPSEPGRRGADRRPGDPDHPAALQVAQLDGVGRAVLQAVDVRPATIGSIAASSGAPIPVTAAALDRMEDAGLVRRHGDWWVRAP